MNSNRQTAKIVGALFLASNITFLLGAMVFLAPILGSTDYLTLVSANRAQVAVGALLELINGIAYVGIAVLMFPLFKPRFESLALAYVGFRLIEFVMQVASSLSPLKLLTLSEEFVNANASDPAAFHTVGSSLIAERYWAFQALGIVFAVGALMFYTMLYQSKLIPRYLSVWGLIGAALVLVNTIIVTLGLHLGSELGAFLGLPMLLNELVLGLWLIVRGFNVSQAVSEPSEPFKTQLKVVTAKSQ
ncbi:MAG: DUF4386 domain-containing protein [Anaerolineae bacterium]